MPEINPSTLDALAQELWDARVSGHPVPPLSSRYPDLTLDQSYEISKRVYERRLSQGERRLGRKIGLTSRAVQAQIGVSQPDFGYLTSTMGVLTGGSIGAHALIQGRAEGEVAFVLSKRLELADLPELPSGPSDAAMIARACEAIFPATDCVIACIEVIDSRVADWKIKIQDTVADNASSAFFILGDRRVHPRDVDLRLAGMKLTRNREIESTGVGAACLDHPAVAMVWLAREMAKRGDPLEAGEIVLSGAYGPIVPFNPGDQVSVEIRGLGKVEVIRGTK